MEPQPCFDLNAAFDCWRHELEAERNLLPDAQKELEAHVRDGVAELGARGLSDEEAFWLSRRRVGRPTELAQEFYKEEPQARARQQALWVATGLLALHGWGRVTDVFRVLYVTERPPVGTAILFNLLWVVPVAALIYMARNGTQNWWRFRSRRQFVYMTSVVIAAVQILDLMARAYLGHPYMGFGSNWIPLFVVNSLWPATLIALVSWLMPTDAGEATA